MDAGCSWLTRWFVQTVRNEWGQEMLEAGGRLWLNGAEWEEVWWSVAACIGAVAQLLPVVSSLTWVTPPMSSGSCLVALLQTSVGRLLPATCSAPAAGGGAAHEQRQPARVCHADGAGR